SSPFIVDGNWAEAKPSTRVRRWAGTTSPPERHRRFAPGPRSEATGVWVTTLDIDAEKASDRLGASAHPPMRCPRRSRSYRLGLRPPLLEAQAHRFRVRGLSMAPKTAPIRPTRLE